MKIIFGLGNPGEQYKNSRHNIGFEIIELIQREWELSPFEFSKKFNAGISRGTYNPQPTTYNLLLVKPQTFMNLSGEAIGKILDFYKLTPEDIIVIHDDLDIALGKFKIAADSTSAGHNGVQNIIDTLGTQKFKRLRIGIGEEVSGGPVCPPRVDEQSPRVEAGRTDAHDFVLAKFSAEEKEEIKKISDDILSAVKGLL